MGGLCLGAFAACMECQLYHLILTNFQISSSEAGYEPRETEERWLKRVANWATSGGFNVGSVDLEEVMDILDKSGHKMFLPDRQISEMFRRAEQGCNVGLTQRICTNRQEMLQPALCHHGLPAVTRMGASWHAATLAAVALKKQLANSN